MRALLFYDKDERSCSFSLDTGKAILPNLIERRIEYTKLCGLLSVLRYRKLRYEISLWQTHSLLKVFQKRCQLQENDVLGDACKGGSCGF